MEGLLLVLLPVMFFVAIVMAVLMFADVAFLGGDRVVEEKERLRRLWEPPYVRGRELLAWARARGAAAAEASLSARASAGGMSSSELHDGATHAMLPRTPDRDRLRKLPCPEGGQGMIGATTPEVLEMAATIRSRLGVKEQRLILERAKTFARAVSEEHSGLGPPTGCALQGEDCVCRTYPARPLRCRPFHADSIRRFPGDPLDDEDAKEGRWTGVVARGLEEGWRSGLDAAGLDDTVYELNSALVVALQEPDLARRWARGEKVLSGCPTVLRQGTTPGP